MPVTYAHAHPVWFLFNAGIALQVQAIREGLMSVIPESVLSLLTWSNLERGVCGDREISVAQLKSACKSFSLEIYLKHLNKDYEYSVWLQFIVRNIIIMLEAEVIYSFLENFQGGRLYRLGHNIIRILNNNSNLIHSFIYSFTKIRTDKNVQFQSGDWSR